MSERPRNPRGPITLLRDAIHHNPLVIVPLLMILAGLIMLAWSLCSLLGWIPRE